MEMQHKLKPCPVCCGEPGKTFIKNGCTIGRCQQCTHTYIVSEPAEDHLSQVYGDNYFTGGGDGYPDYLGEESLLVAHGRRYGRLLLRYMPAGRVLDVGASAGFILKGMVDEGWQGDGIEPNATMARFARERYGLNVQVGALEDMSPDSQYDVVTMIQVAAHFFDVRRAFELASQVTRPGGWWLIETSNKDSLPARFLGENWHLISPPSVQNWFSRNTLKALGEQFGMYPVATGRPEKWLNGGHAKSLLSHKLQGTVGTVARPVINLLPDTLKIPYPSFDLFWMLLQKKS